MCVDKSVNSADFLFFNFVILAKPDFLTQSDRPHSETILIQLEKNITLLCPFGNFDQFQWDKNSVPFNNKTKNIEIHNISRTDQG